MRAKLQLESHIVVRSGYPTLFGTLFDDTKRPATEPVAVRFAAPTSNFVVKECGELGKEIERVRDEYLIRPDALGRFCLRIVPAQGTAPKMQVDATLAVRPNSAYFDSADARVVLDAGKRSVALSFLPAERLVRLDGEARTYQVSALGDDDTPLEAINIALFIGKTALGQATTSEAGRAEFRILPSALGPPGQGELRAEFAGTDAINADSSTFRIEKRVTVDLAIDSSVREQLAAGVSPDDGFTFEARANAHGTIVHEGVIELMVNGASMGAGALREGVAKIETKFSPTTSEIQAELVYRPASTFYEAGLPRPLAIKVAAPSRTRYLPFVIGLVLVGGLLFADLRPKRQREQKSSLHRSIPIVRNLAGIQVVRSLAGIAVRGRVIDAHTDSPIVGARVWIEAARSFTREPIASTQTDANGEFLMDRALEKDKSVALFAEAPFHKVTKLLLHQGGEVVISLTTRKRAILEHLVEWAKRGGKSYDHKPEATPSSVARAGSNNPRVVRWAHEVEYVAYAPVAVDGSMAQATEAMCPDGRSSVPGFDGRTLVDAAPSDAGDAAMAPATFERPSEAALDDSVAKRGQTRKGFF